MNIEDMERSTQSIEVELLVEAIYLRYGYDFRDYSRASVKRRILRRLEKENMHHISELQRKLLYDESFFRTVISDFSINVTEMFRDPLFFQTLTAMVIPDLAKLKQIKVWHAGCGTGEEVYSLAILFKENNIYDKTIFYATDINDETLDMARSGRIPLKDLKKYSVNYSEAGGEHSLSDYLVIRPHGVNLREDLLKNIVFSDHNLVHDKGFGEMNLILCRNVLIYFNRNLQRKVLDLFRESLVRRGYLCLGMKESLYFTDSKDDFNLIDPKTNIYRFYHGQVR